ncbi:MAG: hypothetical protein JXB60_09645 [Candidatus Cloacimonetes bacterium]|nr:hypothetical protein [Candidatus Cloacimonadota bacterium]
MKKIYLFLLMATFLIDLLPGAEFDLRKFTEPEKYGWNSLQEYRDARENLQERVRLLQYYDDNKQSVRKNVIKSLIVPGWGHFAVGNYTKGQIILALELTIMGASIYYYDRAMFYYDKYKKAEYIGDINQYYNNAKDPFLYSQGFFVLGLLVWAYAAYDIIQVTEDYNEKLWGEIFFEYKQKKLEITPQGITIRF